MELTKSSRETIFRTIVGLICLAGLVYQIEQVCVLFFAYKTRSIVTYDASDRPVLPQIFVCIRSLEIIDRTDATYGLLNRLPLTPEEDMNDQEKLTAKQVWDLSPSGEDSFKSCRYRPGLMFRMKKSYGKECNKYFSADKFLIGEYVCYLFGYKNQTHYSRGRISQSLHWNKHVFDIELAEPFKDAKFIQVGVTLVTDKDADMLTKLPATGWLYTRKIANPQQHKSSLETNIFFVYHHSMSAKLMEYPYDTRCSNTCEWYARFCIIDKLKEYNRLPSTEFIIEPVPSLKLVTARDFLNDSFEEIYHQIETQCKQECPSPPCMTSLASTTIDSVINSAINTSVFNVMTPSFTPVSIVYIEVMNLTDFFIYIASAFGIWFGVSFYYLDPVTVYRKVRSLKKTSSQDKNLRARFSQSLEFIEEYLKYRNLLFQREEHGADRHRSIRDGAWY